MTSIPDDFILDVHDFAAILLDVHAKTESLLPNAQLVEINHGDTPLNTLPSSILPEEWYAVAPFQKRVAYILKKDSNASERVNIDTFASSDGVRSPFGAELTRRELEDVFWRCKTFNNGYVLAYTAQRVFDSLPHSARLRVRTSEKYEMLCKPCDVAVSEIDVVAKEAALIAEYEPHPGFESSVALTQHLSGFDGAMLWVFLFIGKPPAEAVNLEADPRVVLDLVTTQIGGRGGGGELFSLERGFKYHRKVLSRIANEHERYKLSGKLRISPDDIRARADALVDAVMGRVVKLANGDDDFCRYCGKEGVNTRCSKCKKARFCQACVALGWKYHKVWCA